MGILGEKYAERTVMELQGDALSIRIELYIFFLIIWCILRLVGDGTATNHLRPAEQALHINITPMAFPPATAAI